MAVISKPVSVSAVASALGVSSYDLGTLCTSGQINKWCKYKPVRSTHLGETGITSGHQYWKGSDGMCGLDIKSTTVPYDIRTLNPDWAYLKPRGAQYYEWFRLLDFDGYKSGGRTTPPTGYLVEDGQQTIFFPYGSNPHFRISILSQGLDTYMLNQGDIVVDGSPLSDWYIGLTGFVESQQIPFLHTSDIKLKEAYGQSIDFSVDPSQYGIDWSGKVWTLCPYLYKPTSDDDTLYISMGNPWSAIVVKVATNTVTGSNAAASLVGSSVNYGFTLRNGYAEAKTIPMRLMFYWADRPEELFDDLRSREYTLPSRTVDAVESESFTGSVAITSHLDAACLGVILQYQHNNVWENINDSYGSAEIWLRGTPPPVSFVKPKISE